MKKFFLLLAFVLIFSEMFAQSKKNLYIGFQTGIVTPLSFGDYSVSRYRVGLPSFSYSAGLENRFALNNKLNFSLQYSLTYFSLMQRNYKLSATGSGSRESEVAASLNVNTIYKIKRDVGIIGGVGVSNPLQGAYKKNTVNESAYSAGSAKKSLLLNPSFIIGLENSTVLFKRSLIYSLQYNIGFLPYRNLPMQKTNTGSENQYLQGVHIGLKYKY